VRNDLFHNLDLDWASFERSRAGSRALVRWRAGEPEMSEVSSLGGLVEALGDRLRPERQDALMSALLRQSREDTDARRVILRVLTPALVNVSRGYSMVMGNDDAASVTVLAAMERMTSYTASRPGRPAANLMQDVRYTVYRASLRESAVPTGHPPLLSIEDAELVCPEAAELTASEYLLRILAEAISGGRLTGDGGRVIILTRIADVPTATLAKADGVRPSSIRKRRERAEAALGNFALEVA
jgi:hypothetical protein